MYSGVNRRLDLNMYILADSSFNFLAIGMGKARAPPPFSSATTRCSEPREGHSLFHPFHALSYLCANQISLLQIFAHQQFVLNGLSPKLAPWQIDAVQQQHTVDSRICVHFPPLLLHFNYSSNHHIPNFALVSSSTSKFF